jgi:hypothetical protein
VFARAFIVVFLLSCSNGLVWAQNGATSKAGASQSATSTLKSSAKRAAPESRIASRQAASPAGGPCQIGIIPALGNRLSLQHVGLTVFGNELTDVPIEGWGLDDIVVARVRAASGGGISVKRIAYANGAFDSLYRLQKQGFRDGREDLPAVVRQIAANSNCDRYVVVTTSIGPIPGTNQTGVGLGLFTNWANGMTKQGALFAFVQIAVLDGRAFTLHEDPAASIGARLANSLSFFAKEKSFQQVEYLEAPASPEATAGDAQLRDGMRALLTEKLDKMLPTYLDDGRRTQ